MKNIIYTLSAVAIELGISEASLYHLIRTPLTSGLKEGINNHFSLGTYPEVFFTKAQKEKTIKQINEKNKKMGA